MIYVNVFSKKIIDKLMILLKLSLILPFVLKASANLKTKNKDK